MSYTQLREWDKSQTVTDAERLGRLNAISEGSRLAALYESELAALLSGESLVKLLQYVNFGLVKADIEAQNHLGVALWAGKLQLLTIITADEAAAVQAYCQRTDPDHSLSRDVWGVDSTSQSDLDRARGGEL